MLTKAKLIFGSAKANTASCQKQLTAFAKKRYVGLRLFLIKPINMWFMFYQRIV